MRSSKFDPRLLTLLQNWQTANPPQPGPGHALRVTAARVPMRRVMARAPRRLRRAARPAVLPAVAARLFIESRAAQPPAIPHATSVKPVGGGMWTATVPIERIPDLAGDRTVRRATLARKLRPLLDKALPRVHLPAFRTRAGLTGAGVILGIIDTGLDAQHAVFAGRVLRVWDQTRRGPGVAEGAYGIEQIGATLARARDTDGHGTHVAGIAAGADPVFDGVAPGASIIAVRTTMDDTDIADAVRYIFRVADDQNMPAVINLSIGGHDDAHDGSDLLCRVIDEASGPGRIVCCAAGNEGDDNIHGVTRVTRAGIATMRFQVPESSVLEASLTGWYRSGMQLEVAVRTPDGKVTPFQPVVAGGGAPSRTYRLSGTTIIVTTPGPDPANGDINFRVTLRNVTRGRSVRQGVWQLRVRRASGRAATLHVWTLDDADEPQVVFTGRSREDAMKVGSPGSADRAITVGSFTTRVAWTSRDGDDVELAHAPGTITSFSSEGPLRNGRRKPDVTAPGAGIAAARSRLSQPDPEDLITDAIVVQSGSSMASPFVAGLVALLLERDPTLTPEQVKRRLKAASRIPGRRAGTFDRKWGYGLVDADRL